MRISVVTGLVCVAVTMASCGFSQFNSGSEVKNTPASDAVTQVNAKAFNAFNIWRDGQGTEILDYPQGYELLEGTAEYDGVFFGQLDDWKWRDRQFISVPTEGAKVVNDVLEYPSKNGKQLKLKFWAAAPTEMKHLDAVAHCKQQGLRLPTIREVFDFCTAGTVPNETDNFGNTVAGGFGNNRCGPELYPWSASVDSNDRDQAWVFDPHYGIVYVSSRNSRFYHYDVVCVGPAE